MEPRMSVGATGMARTSFFGLRRRVAWSVNTGEPNDIVVVNDDGSFAVNHRAHGQLGLRRDTDLAHEDQIERRVELGGDFCGHDNTATRESEDHRVLILVADKSSSELASRVRSVLEGHCTLSRLNLR
jgi:hypothetical protein